MSIVGLCITRHKNSTSRWQIFKKAGEPDPNEREKLAKIIAKCEAALNE